jgi:hypothetical protein
VALPEGLDRSDASGPARLFLGRRRIWVADAAGSSQPVRLTGDDGYRDEEPMWLADGRHILFCRIRPGPVDGDGAVQSTKSVWLMDAQGGGATEVAGPLQGNDTFEGEGWFGYYGTTDWRAVMDCRRGGK